MCAYVLVSAFLSHSLTFSYCLRVEWEKMSYFGVGVSPGKVAVSHSTNVEVLDRRIKVAELVLRCIVCGLGVLATILVATDTQVKEIFTIQKKAKFTDMKALVFLVTANAIAAAYSLIQGLRCIVSMFSGHVLFSKPLAWIIFSGDQVVSDIPTDKLHSIVSYFFVVICVHTAWRGKVMAYLMVAAVGVSAQSAAFAKLGQPELQWMKICDMYGKFCNQVGEGIVSAVLASLSMVVLSCISAFSVFRLYGGDKNKNLATARW